MPPGRMDWSRTDFWLAVGTGKNRSSTTTSPCTPYPLPSELQGDKVGKDYLLQNLHLDMRSGISNGLAHSTLEKARFLAEKIQKIDYVNPYDKIGSEGNGLSTGQKQRVLIARASYRNARCLFLDEATNSLDANNEKAIMNNFNDLFKNKTVVIVAHRLSTVKKADNIIVLDKGKIAEQGTHGKAWALLQCSVTMDTANSPINVVARTEGKIEAIIAKNESHVVEDEILAVIASNADFESVLFLVSRPVDKGSGVLSDETIRLTGYYSTRKYPDTLRLVVYEDFETGKVYRFLTNNFAIEDPLAIAELYRERWQIELFFKWIKQHLHIKTFYGTTKNAVYTQIWIAVCDYLLLIIAKKRYGLVPSLHSISNSIGQVLFQRADIRELYNQPIGPVIVPEAGSVDQLTLW